VKGLNRDAELLKIQILADYYHNKFTLMLSFLMTGLIGFAIAVLTLVFEGRITLVGYYLYLVVIFVPFSYWIYTNGKEYSENLNNVEGLLEQVDNGVALPSIRELKKGIYAVVNIVEESVETVKNVTTSLAEGYAQISMTFTDDQKRIADSANFPSNLGILESILKQEKEQVDLIKQQIEDAKKERKWLYLIPVIAIVVAILAWIFPR
jgi:Ca2+/Na+ antiporter